jgi:3-hydroxybutyryl-CoA dehydrogenase
MTIQTVAVLGAGTMGRGIAHVTALSGRAVRLFDVSQEQVDSALASIHKNLEGGVQRGKVAPEARDTALTLLSGVSDLPAAVDGVDLVVEAVPEILDLKRSLLAQVDEAAPAGAIFGTNTSSLSIAKIAEGSRDPGRVIGLHFFNPVHIMKLLEIVVSDGTRPEVLEACRTWGAAIGKECITVRDFPGFATSRLGVCLGMEAIRMVEQGVASPEDIDTAMVLGYRHPVGPLKLSDLVGLDVRMHIGEYLAEQLDNPAFRPPELMKRMVAEGRLGQKAGRGFYDWS